MLPQAGLDQIEAVGLAAQDGTTKAQDRPDTRHRQHTDLHHRVGGLGDLEHWKLEKVVHFEVVHMIAGYSEDNDHYTDHHDSPLHLRGGSFPPVIIG